MLNDSESKDSIYEALGKLFFDEDFVENWYSDSNGDEFFKTISNWEIHKKLYSPSQELKERLKDYEKWYTTRQGEDEGQLMEEIAFLAFQSLSGWDDIASYQSFSSQHDLVISGSSGYWFLLTTYLQLPQKGRSRSIVVEAKNIDDSLSDQQFSRLCYIVQNKFSSTSHLGVFFTREGGSGFTYYRALRDAHATQILFHAISQKFVIVFDHNDVLTLKEDGSLAKLMMEKIKDIEKSSKLPYEYDGEWIKVNLPTHLERWVKDKHAKTGTLDSS